MIQGGRQILMASATRLVSEDFWGKHHWCFLVEKPAVRSLQKVMNIQVVFL